MRDGALTQPVYRVIVALVESKIGIMHVQLRLAANDKIDFGTQVADSETEFILLTNHIVAGTSVY